MNAESLLQYEHKGYKLWVTLNFARETYQRAIGAHAEQSQFVPPATLFLYLLAIVPRIEHDSALMVNAGDRYTEWSSLGMSPLTYSVGKNLL
jgi:hypothetical protein